MEARNYTSKFELNQAVRVSYPDYEFFHNRPHPLEGKTGKVISVIFPGDILYESAGIPNGTGEIKYRVQLDIPTELSDKYLLSANELLKV